MSNNVTSVTVHGVFELPIKQVIANPKANARSSMNEEAVEDLAQTIKREGQMQAVRVEKRPDGKYELVFGFRRHAAITKLGQETIRAEVIEPMDPAARKIANIAENMAREDLTTYDQSMAFLDLQKSHDMSGSKIANSVGKSVPYVNNLIRIAEGLDESILRRWREECAPNFGKDKEGKKLPNVHAVCTTEWLGKLVAKVPRANQEYELKVAMGLIDPDAEDDDDEEDGEGNKRGRSDLETARRATMKNLEKALKAAEEKLGQVKAEEKPEVKGVISALKFAMGKTQGIKGVYTTPKPGEEKKEEGKRAN